MIYRLRQRRESSKSSMMYPKLFLMMTLILLLNSTVFSQGAREAPKTISFGVFPFLSVSRLEPIFAPISAILKDSLKLEVLYRNTSNFDQFTDNLKNQLYHLAYINPLDYTKIAKAAGYIPIATQKDSLHMLFVVLQSDPLQSIEKMRGQRIIVPPKMSTGAFLTNMTLTNRGIAPNRDVMIKHAGRYDACLQQLLIGNADVAVVDPASLKKFEREMNIKFRILLQSTNIPNNLFVVHRSLPSKLIQQIQRTMLSISLPWQAKEFFQGSRPFMPAKDADYEIVRSHYAKFMQPLGSK